MNNAIGHQQVNGGAPSLTGELECKKNTPNKLSEGCADDILQNLRTAASSTGEDSTSETMEKAHRALINSGRSMEIILFFGKARMWLCMYLIGRSVRSRSPGNYQNYDW